MNNMSNSLNDLFNELNRKPTVIDSATLEAKKMEVKEQIKSVYPPNEQIANAIVSYLAKSRLNLKPKGLCFFGGVGTGKTTALKIIRGLGFAKFFYATDLERHLEYNEMTLQDAFKREQKIIVDDIGVEPSSNDYGVKYEIVERLINLRHRQYIEKGFTTFLSSNLPHTALISRYGERTFSRISEMCDIVICNGNDLRKGK